MVHYVARYQYANMKHVIQMYSAVEVRSVIQFYTVQNHSATEIHEKLCAVYGSQCMSPPYTAHNFSCISVALHFVRCKIVLRFQLPALYIWIVCSMFAYWYLATYRTVWLEMFTVYPATQNLVLPLIWFHSIHSWPCTNLRKLTFETTFVRSETMPE